MVSGHSSRKAGGPVRGRGRVTGLDCAPGRRRIPPRSVVVAPLPDSSPVPATRPAALNRATSNGLLTGWRRRRKQKGIGRVPPGHRADPLITSGSCHDNRVPVLPFRCRPETNQTHHRAEMRSLPRRPTMPVAPPGTHVGEGQAGETADHAQGRWRERSAVGCGRAGRSLRFPSPPGHSSMS